MAKLLRISKGGQVSLPAAIRKRWDTNAVLVEDRGDHAVFRPTVDDPITAARGAFAKRARGGPTGVEAVREGRAQDVEAEQTKIDPPGNRG